MREHCLPVEANDTGGCSETTGIPGGGLVNTAQNKTHRELVINTGDYDKHLPCPVSADFLIIKYCMILVIKNNNK